MQFIRVTLDCIKSKITQSIIFINISLNLWIDVLYVILTNIDRNLFS